MYIRVQQFACPLEGIKGRLLQEWMKHHPHLQELPAQDLQCEVRARAEGLWGEGEIHAIWELVSFSPMSCPRILAST